MIIQAISDTHGSDFESQLNDCDILLIAGDISPVNMNHSFDVQAKWFANTFCGQLEKLKSKAKHIVFIGGNHDTYLSDKNEMKENESVRELLPSNVHYLCDDMVTIEGIKIYGTPWCNLPSWARKGPPVWNFALPDEKLSSIYSKIPTDIDILLTHGPAKGRCDSILDKGIIDIAPSNANLGSASLMATICRGINAKYVLSGHIHSAQRQFSKYIKSADNLDDCIQFSCVSILNEQYKFEDKYKPLLINW